MTNKTADLQRPSHGAMRAARLGDDDNYCQTQMQKVAVIQPHSLHYRALDARATMRTLFNFCFIAVLVHGLKKEKPNSTADKYKLKQEANKKRTEVYST